MNTAAIRLGTQRGMTRAEAELTGAELFSRNSSLESSARDALLCILHRYTPRVEDASRGTNCVLVMDVTGTKRIFGPPYQIAKDVLTMAETVGLRANAAISANYETCIALASCATARIVEVTAGEEARQLSALPLQAMISDEDTQAVFQMWGLKSFGDLACLPLPQLVARLGSKANAMLALARGEHAHLFRPIEIVSELRETMRFDDPIELLEPLLFVLNCLLDALLRRVNANLEAVAAVTVTLHLDGAGEHSRRVSPALPTQDRGLLLKLLQLDLSANPPPAGVVAVSIAGETGALNKMQLGLFCPQHPEPTRLEVLLARIAALVGEKNVGHPGLCDSNHDAAFRVERFLPKQKVPFETCDAFPSSALRRLRPPVDIFATTAMPQTIRYESVTYAVNHVYGPWKSSGAWWLNSVWAEESWDFVAESSQNTILIGVMVHDRLRKSWRLDALYD